MTSYPNMLPLQTQENGKPDTAYIMQNGQIVGKVDHATGLQAKIVDSKKVVEWTADNKVSIKYDPNETNIRLSEDFSLDHQSVPAIRFNYYYGDPKKHVGIDKLRADGTTEYSALYTNFTDVKLTLHDAKGAPEASLYFRENAIGAAFLPNDLATRADFRIYDADNQPIDMKNDDTDQRAAILSQFQKGWNGNLNRVADEAKLLANIQFSDESEQESNKLRAGAYGRVLKGLENTF